MKDKKQQKNIRILHSEEVLWLFQKIKKLKEDKNNGNAKNNFQFIIDFVQKELSQLVILKKKL